MRFSRQVRLRPEPLLAILSDSSYCSVLSIMALSGGRPDLWLSEDRRSARFVKLLLCLALLGSTTASSTLEARYDHAALPSGAGHEGVGAGASTKGYAWLIVVHGSAASVLPFLVSGIELIFRTLQAFWASWHSKSLPLSRSSSPPSDAVGRTTSGSGCTGRCKPTEAGQSWSVLFHVSISPMYYADC